MLYTMRFDWLVGWLVYYHTVCKGVETGASLFIAGCHDQQVL